ncbi:SDC2 [Lepeophtheirus salmonis]|uniref:Syndecan n=1 Tax=Lepeophtheirus salmonis TaxID=72036 RepID=A0A0K2VE25_LEPSM|nr:syndecan-like [Lepeophtheirus salmonis]CAB4061427.1 SDC2 [Lepeophtheirus salmonis]CAF2884429.1 SDC2 [Lepeophtheirus salmonis]
MFYFKVLTFFFFLQLCSIQANYIWKDTDWVYLEKGAKQKQPVGIEGSGDKFDQNTDRSYGSIKTYNDDTEDDEGSGYGISVDHPSPEGIDQEEEEDVDNYFENSGESATVSETDDFHSNNYDSSDERSRNVPISPPVDSTEDPFFEDNRSDDISFEAPVSTQSTPKLEGGNPSITGPKTKNKSASFFAQPGIMAAVVGGAVVGLLCAILFVMFIVYRMRKKDEGSYALDEPKRSPTVNSYSKPLSREIYA